MKANQCCAAGAHRRYFRQCKNKYFRLSHSIRWFTAGLNIAHAQLGPPAHSPAREMISDVVHRRARHLVAGSARRGCDVGKLACLRSGVNFVDNGVI